MKDCADLPTSLKILVNRLDAYLQANTVMPVVTNPMLPTESFNEHWDQEKYDLFKKQVQTLNKEVNDAYDEQDETESVEEWQLIFGDDFSSLKDEMEDKAGGSSFRKYRTRSGTTVATQFTLQSKN